MGAAERVIDRVRRYVLSQNDRAATKKAIAAACGVQVNLVRGWMTKNSRSAPTIYYLDAIADVIGVSAAELVARPGERVVVVARLAQEPSDQVQGAHPRREVDVPMSDPMFLTLHQVWTGLDPQLRKRLVNLATAEHNPRKPRGDLQRSRKSGR